MSMYINLNTYLSHLKAIESRKAKEVRKKVPSLSELASSIGMHQTSLSRLANNKVNQLTLDTGGKIIAEMRRRGFPMQITDLIDYRDDEAVN